MNTLATLMNTKKATLKNSKVNAVRLGQFKSPVNGEFMEVVAKLEGNSKTGDMVQISVLPLDGVVKAGTESRKTICGSCPLTNACYAQDQGLPTMINAYLSGDYPFMTMEEFLPLIKNRFVRLGRFGDMSLLPYEFVKQITDNCKGFTGYTNQWRSKYFDERFTNIMMVSTVGYKDSKEAAKRFPNARQYRVIHEKADYTHDLDKGFITCANVNGFNCDECLLCDGSTASVADTSIEIRVHGVNWKTKRVNKMLKKDVIATFEV